jgi:hypothetical protein
MHQVQHEEGEQGGVTMPRDYGKVSHRFWTGETGKQIRVLGLEERVVATYLVTCGSSNMIGLYYLPLMLIAHETGIPFEGASKALRRLSEAQFSHYDESTEVVFVPHMAREQIAETLSLNDKQRHGVIAMLKEYKKSRFVADFVELYGAAYKLPSDLLDESPSKPLASPLEAPPKPENREQDQITENREQPPSGPLRPNTAMNLEICMRKAIQREQPQNGQWVPGRFSYKDAQKLLADLGDVEKVLPELERKIELFAKDPDMQPWTMAKFVDKYNAIGLPKLEYGKAPKQVNDTERTPIRW